jgi:dTDP-4-amino-4,6-dideoxygalactose transaminase
MDNIQAAILLPQLDRLEDNWRKRQALARQYQQGLWDIPSLKIPRSLPGVEHAWHLFPVWIGDGRRDEVVQKMQDSGIGVMVNYRAIHLLTYFRETFGYAQGAFPVAESIGDASLSLPFYPNMPTDHVDYAVDTLREILS